VWLGHADLRLCTVAGRADLGLRRCARAAAPFVARVKLDDAKLADSPPAGSMGTVAIFTDRVKAAHFIRKVLLRQTAILNYINPF
jgi:hypothetical protein